MKKYDIIFVIAFIALFAPFFIFPSVFDFYEKTNHEHWLLLGMLKFAILSTIGEVIALRIRKGVFNEKGFGILPRALVWALLGGWIVIAMKLFWASVPPLMDKLFNTNGVFAAAMLTPGFSFYKLGGAFGISLVMNTSFAPIFMTLHKITDMHISRNGGSISCLTKGIDMSASLGEINWKVQWGFVFKRTIPFFWIPAHTLTFCLPPDMQVLFAACLGMALGLIMAVAANKK